MSQYVLGLGCVRLLEEEEDEIYYEDQVDEGFETQTNQMTLRRRKEKKRVRRGKSNQKVEEKL